MIFGLFKKKKTNKDINTDIDTDWLKELYELLGEKMLNLSLIFIM